MLLERNSMAVPLDRLAMESRIQRHYYTLDAVPAIPEPDSPSAYTSLRSDLG